MATVDIDAAQAAKAEVKGEPHILHFRDEDFIIPASADDLPLDFYEALEVGRSVAAVYALFGDQAEAFRNLKPTMADALAVLAEASRLYGFGSLGESSASNGSSRNGSSRSRPTSPASTGST